MRAIAEGTAGNGEWKGVAGLQLFPRGEWGFFSLSRQVLATSLRFRMVESFGISCSNGMNPGFSWYSLFESHCSLSEPRRREIVPILRLETYLISHLPSSLCRP